MNWHEDIAVDPVICHGKFWTDTDLKKTEEEIVRLLREVTASVDRGAR